MTRAAKLTAKITKRTVDAAKPQAARYTLWDTELKGFGLRVEPSGSKSYVLRYRTAASTLRQLHIGKHGAMTPEQARKQASIQHGKTREGRDPVADKRSAREGLSFGELADTFLKEHVAPKRKASTKDWYQWLVEKHVRPQFGSKRADSIIRADIARLHLKMGGAQANRMVAVVSSMYSWASKNGLVPEGYNPARGVEKFKESRRERFLTIDEMERLGAAIREGETDGVPWDLDETKAASKHMAKEENRRTKLSLEAAAAIRLLIFTGARLREILHLEWSHVDFERGLLLLPDSKTGAKAIVLNAPAVAVLASLPHEGRFVIKGERPAGGVAERARSDLKRPWALVSRRAGLDQVRVHDLRHTFASYGAGANLGLPVIGKLLGHAQAATTQRYAHLESDPLRRASETIAGRISAAMDGGKSAEVTPLRPAAK
ncbi:integrase [Rhodoligotrophos appendicifer]|uniref:site-specific integrase n=1 Tax=Rhodoligotrophos appendicifer TaxID=987056 RepID=UPI001180C4A1|nr:site-specific integrase [Rhodoligotrophos appendicifer]